MNSLVSIVIPVYNAEKTIVRCVESILYGALDNINIILVDDCSKDNSWNVCQKLSRQYKNVRSFRNKENAGVSFTRNRGIAEIESKYVMFVDSDDWVSKEYVTKLLYIAEKYPEALAICGLQFRDEVNNCRKDYLWNVEEGQISFVDGESFFELLKKFHLQQLWNKIFRRDIIEKNQLRFDEKQSMGEDFQFVLDYMEAMKCKQCVVINEPLYYYIRANSISLMSNFGASQEGYEYKRFEKLLKISGENNLRVCEQYKNTVQATKNNFVYQVCHNRNIGVAEKIRRIEYVMQDGKAKLYYRKQQIILFKERVIEMKRKWGQLLPRLRGRLQRMGLERNIQSLRKKCRAKNITIISQNCIGGTFYHDMNMEFLSPTINLFIRQPDFVKLVLNLEKYMAAELVMSWGEEYPIGILGGDIRIDFMHYRSCSEAKEAWNRRKARINYDRVLVLSTDRNGFDDSVFEAWKTIPYPKVLFTVHKKYNDISGTVVYSQYAADGCVPDLIPQREIYKDGELLFAANSFSEIK
ncbi:DUF1919 domain-containing protein [Bacteroides acidifaciens]|uniref:DUF1919 domain-containing protein n=1 Tax=Bacteroides acidifaciens TaxID=85831 RepID=UPI0026E9D3BD|nr:DUF1919 domain-containing protein [Bacteroides acidifaciens]